MTVAILFILLVNWEVTANRHTLPGKFITTGKIKYNNTQHLQLGQKKYKPKWSDLDTRPLPEWYDRAKVGIFLHWGVYSVPAFEFNESEWFWYYWKAMKIKQIKTFMNKTYPPGFKYRQFAPKFTAEFFDPDEWARLFKKAGAKYIILTSKHHDGFTLFPPRRSSSWNSVAVGPHKDLVGDLSKAVKNAGLEFGVYYSLYEWFNPIYLKDSKSRFTSHEYPENIVLLDLKQLVNDYKPSVLWSDGDWEASDVYWNSPHFLAWLYNESPVKDRIVVNDRWGIGSYCNHGDFYNCKDRYHPWTLQPHKWENAFTVDKVSWGYRRDTRSSRILTIKEIINILVTTVSCGGNVLINVGPTKEGRICPLFQKRLLDLGAWLNVNGEAIYDSSPWLYQKDTINNDVWYTCKKMTYNGRRPTAKPDKTDKLTAVYAIFLKWPKDSVLRLGAIAPELYKAFYHIKLLGLKGQYLTWSSKGKEANIKLPDKAKVNSDYAWTLKFIKKY